MILSSRLIPILLFLGISVSGPLLAADQMHEHLHPAPSEVEKRAIGVDEQLGEKIPLDTIFINEAGEEVRLGDLITRPTIIAPVYYHCPNVCNFLQAGLAMVLPQIDLKASKEYQVLSVSFDVNDTPQLARTSRNTYFTAMRSEYPAEGWQFLTGSQASIDTLLDSIGYGVERKGVDFLHPVAVAVVGKDGTITRYLYGTSFLPSDLTLALIEASEGRIGTAVQRALTLCFNYDPEGKRYVFNLLRVAGVVVGLTAFLLLLFLMLSGPKKRTKKPTSEPQAAQTENRATDSDKDTP